MLELHGVCLGVWGKASSLPHAAGSPALGSSLAASGVGWKDESGSRFPGAVGSAPVEEGWFSSLAARGGCVRTAGGPLTRVGRAGRAQFSPSPGCLQTSGSLGPARLSPPSFQAASFHRGVGAARSCRSLLDEDPCLRWLLSRWSPWEGCAGMGRGELAPAESGATRSGWPTIGSALKASLKMQRRGFNPREAPAESGVGFSFLCLHLSSLKLPLKAAYGFIGFHHRLPNAAKPRVCLGGALPPVAQKDPGAGLFTSCCLWLEKGELQRGSCPGWASGSISRCCTLLQGASARLLRCCLSKREKGFNCH